MTVEQLIDYLRMSVHVQDPNIGEDSEYLSMTDDDLKLFLEIVMSRDYPQIQSLDRLPSEAIYSVTLLAKKELYYSLAVKEAPLYDLGADNNNYLKRSQRFDHYMKLIAQVDKEYQDYLEDGGAGRNTLTSFDVLLSERYYTKRNYEKGVEPAPILYVNKIGEDFVEIEWSVKLSKFKKYEVYISEGKPVLDTYNLDNVIKGDAVKVVEIKDVHKNKCRIVNLKPLTLYYVAVMTEDLSKLKGYAEAEFRTYPDPLTNDFVEVSI